MFGVWYNNRGMYFPPVETLPIGKRPPHPVQQRDVEDYINGSIMLLLGTLIVYKILILGFLIGQRNQGRIIISKPLVILVVLIFGDWMRCICGVAILVAKYGRLVKITITS